MGEAKLGENPPQAPAQYYELIVSFLGKEVVKFIDDHYRTKSNPEDRAILANGFSGPDAFMTALKHPGLFGAFGSQSLFMLSSDEEMVRGAIKTAQEQPLQIYLDWGLYDLRTSRENWDIPEANRRLIRYLRERGYKPAGGETHESFGWASWRNRLDRVLVTLASNPVTTEYTELLRSQFSFFLRELCELHVLPCDAEGGYTSDPEQALYCMWMMYEEDSCSGVKGLSCFLYFLRHRLVLPMRLY